MRKVCPFESLYCHGVVSERLNASHIKTPYLWHVVWNLATMWNTNEDLQTEEQPWLTGLQSRSHWAEPGTCCLGSCHGILKSHEVSVDTPPRTLETSLCFEFCFIYCSLASPLTSHPHLLCILPPPSWTLYTFSGLQFFTKHSLWVLPTWVSLSFKIQLETPFARLYPSRWPDFAGYRDRSLGLEPLIALVCYQWGLTRQGCKLSDALFALYLGDLVQHPHFSNEK